MSQGAQALGSARPQKQLEAETCILSVIGLAPRLTFLPLSLFLLCLSPSFSAWYVYMLCTGLSLFLYVMCAHVVCRAPSLSLCDVHTRMCRVLSLSLCDVYTCCVQVFSSAFLTHQKIRCQEHPDFPSDYLGTWWETDFFFSVSVSECPQKDWNWPRLNQMSRLPRWPSGKESAHQCRTCRRHGFSLWVKKIPWRRKWHPYLSILAWRIPWTEQSGGLQSVHAVTKNRTQLSTWARTLSTPGVHSGALC